MCAGGAARLRARYRESLEAEVYLQKSYNSGLLGGRGGRFARISLR
jgi:hypothetical protein